MLSTIALTPVTRTQEARVVESAREMIDNPVETGLRAWLIPRANGIVRLQKPPLAYWLSAVSFKIFGVHDWAGRLPFALCGWLTVVLTYHIAAHALNSARIGVWSAALLAGSFLFYRHARLAETDVLLTLALTIAIYAIWRGFHLDDRRHLLWFALSGVAIGLAAMTKGLPALFPIVFLIAMIAITRRWRVALRWLISGAPILALLIGLPWWIYVWRLPGAEIYTRELSVLVDEPTHPGWFFIYFAYLMEAMLPWAPVLVLALIDAAIRWRRDPRVVIALTPLLVWCGAIFVPLCVIANKQEHYLMPMMPPLAMVAAWWLDQVQRNDQRIARVIARIAGIALALVALALPIASRADRGDVLSSDLIIAIVLLVVAIIVFRDARTTLTTFCVGCAITITSIIGFWWPTMVTRSHRDVAAEIREIAPGPFYFYGENFSLPLAYNLRAVVPQLQNARELTEAMSRHPELIVIAVTKPNRPPPPVPIGMETVRELFTKEQKFAIYRSIQ